MQGFLAIDVAKDTLESAVSVGVADSGKALQMVPNTNKGWRRILRECQQMGITELFVCLEATGSYWKKLAAFLHSQGIKVAVVNPARIKAQRKTEQTRTKTDRVDALVILRFFKSQFSSLHWWIPPSVAVIQLQSLVRYRETCVRQKIAEQNLLNSGGAHRAVVQMAQHHIDELEDRIDQIETLIAEVIASDETLKALNKSIVSVSGVAETTSAILIAEARAFAEIRDPRQATAFAGLDVVEYQSGTIRRPPRISKQGNALLRLAFIRIAPSASNRKGIWRELYKNFLAKGLHKRQAHVAVARKMLEVAVAVAVSGELYDKEKHARALGFATSQTAA